MVIAPGGRFQPAGALGPLGGEQLGHLAAEAVAGDRDAGNVIAGIVGIGDGGADQRLELLIVGVGGEGGLGEILDPVHDARR